MHRILFPILLIYALSGCWFSEPADFITLERGPFRAAYLIPDPDKDFVRLEFIVQSGEFDNDGPEGLAHYVEHLAWLQQLDARGRSSSRHSNAWTRNVATGYFISGPSKDFAKNLERLVSVTEPFGLPKSFMDEERGIVQREYDKRVRENAYYQLYLDIERSLYGETGHSKRPIGTPETISSFTLDLAREFHAKTHLLANTVLIASGNLTEAQLNAEIAKLGSSEDVPASLVPEFPSEDLYQEEDVFDDQIASPELHYVKLVPVEGDWTDQRLAVARSVLEDALDSTLPGGIATPLRFDAFLAESFDFDLYVHENTHLEMRFMARADRGVALDDLQSAFEQALAATEATGIPNATFEKIKKREITDIEAVEDPQGITSSIVTGQVTYKRPPYGYSDLLVAASAVTLEDINVLYRALIGDGRTVIRRVAPNP